MIKRPVPHDSDALSLSLPIGSHSAGLEQLVEGLEAKAPVSAWTKPLDKYETKYRAISSFVAQISHLNSILSVHI